MFLVSNRKLNENKGKRVQIRRNCVLCCKAFIILGAERTPSFIKRMKKMRKKIFSLPDVRVSQLPPPLPPPQRPVLSGFSDPPPGGVSRTSFVNAPLSFLQNE